jgi:Bacterial Ig-like domain (group 1)
VVKHIYTQLSKIEKNDILTRFMKQTHMNKTVAAILVGCIMSIQCTTATALTIIQEKTVAGIPTTITLQDVSNTAHTLSVLPPYGAEMLYPLAKQSTQSVMITGTDLEIAGEYRLSVLSDAGVVAQGSLTVSPSNFSTNNSVISSNMYSVIPNGSDTATITVTARDEFDNVLQNRPIKVVSSRITDNINAVSNATDANGEQEFTLRTSEPGTITLRAIDLITGDTVSNSINITAGASQSFGGPSVQNRTNVAFASPFAGNVLEYKNLYGQAAMFEDVHHFSVEVEPVVQANNFLNLTITAKDSNNLTVEDFEGTVELAASDPSATLPSFGVIRFNAADLGRKTLVQGLRFTTPGTHILYAELSTNQSVNGQTEVQVVGTNTVPIVSQKISVFSPAPNAVLNAEQEITIKGKGPAFSNLIVQGGAFDITTETDSDGNFTATIALTNSNEHTIRIVSDNGTADSGDITFYTDTTAPEITAIEFDPVMPVANTDVLISVKTNEPADAMREITLTINDTTVVLEQTGDFVYQYVFTPSSAGMLKAEVTAIDKAGNESTLQSMIEVQLPSVPTVQNVRGVIEDNIAIVEWDVVPNTNQYRIYIGDTESGEYSYTLETNLTEAKINGLAPGAVYYIAVTAVQDNRESKEKSNELVLDSPKTLLKATPGNNEVLLEWESPLEEDTIASWVLRYGTEPDYLIEERTLNGQLRRFTVADLINEQNYYFTLTPITITGQLLEEASSSTEAMPSGSGLHSGAPDPIPDNILANLGKGKGKDPIIKPDIVPDQPTTGAVTLPSILLGTVLACILYFIWLKRREQKIHKAFLHRVHDLYTVA